MPAPISFGERSFPCSFERNSSASPFLLFCADAWAHAGGGMPHRRSCLANALQISIKSQGTRIPNSRVGRAGWRRQLGRRSGRDGVSYVIRTLPALALLSASAYAAASPALSAESKLNPTAAWWEKVTLTIAGDG